MTKKQLATAKERLLEMLGEVESRLSLPRPERGVPSGSDVLDQSLENHQIAASIQFRGDNFRTKRAILEAQERIADGSYGQCAHCEEEIAPKRLAALPTALLCIGCQRQMEAKAEPLLPQSLGLLKELTY